MQACTPQNTWKQIENQNTNAHTYTLRRVQPLHRLYVKTITGTACQKQQRNREALTAEKKERAKNTAIGPAKADKGEMVNLH